jgi:hypothetical protein
VPSATANWRSKIGTVALPSGVDCSMNGRPTHGFSSGDRRTSDEPGSARLYCQRAAGLCRRTTSPKYQTAPSTKSRLAGSSNASSVGSRCRTSASSASSDPGEKSQLSPASPAQAGNARSRSVSQRSSHGSIAGSSSFGGVHPG